MIKPIVETLVLLAIVSGWCLLVLVGCDFGMIGYWLAAGGLVGLVYLFGPTVYWSWTDWRARK